MKDGSKKSAWDDLSLNWKKLAAVIAGVGLITTFVCDLFKWPVDKVLPVFAFMGVMILILAWYVDKQSQYTHEEILKYEHKAREDFTKAIHETREIAIKSREDSEARVSKFEEKVTQIIKVTEDTRKDTLRIQLILLMKEEADNIDTILKLAEVYFVQLKGDWYMTNQFMQWAKAHDVIIPMNIATVINEHN